MKPHDYLLARTYGDCSGCGTNRRGVPYDLFPAWGQAAERGQDLAEYGLLMAFISVFVIVAVGLVGTRIVEFFDIIVAGFAKAFP